jgi:hypothetical protein
VGGGDEVKVICIVKNKTHNFTSTVAMYTVQGADDKVGQFLDQGI